PDVMALLHQRGMRGYVTLNTLAFPSELPMVEKTIRTLAETGVDAVLVQDLGVLQLVRAVCPDLAIHASTQMSLTSAECINVAERLGVERIVLARELSIDEIRAIRSQTRVPLEVFVHGALCVAYSGQCLTSESLGGRSANRGQCAQACRLPFDLVCDGRDVELGQVKYLLSPQDLAAFDLIPQLIDAGVSALKIEGRLKTAEYVANVTRHYREAIDTALAGRPVQFTPRQIEEMELSFSRGFSPGWLLGNDHKRLVPGKSSANRGVLLGEVTQVRGQRVQVRLSRGIKAGDGITFEGDRLAGLEQGGRVWAVYQGGRRLEAPVDHGLVELTFVREAVDFDQLWPGQQIWKTDDPELARRIRRSYTDADPQRRVPVTMHVRAAVGEPLYVRARTATGAACEVQSDEPLPAARQHPVTRELLEEKLGRLGGTVHELGRLDAEIVGGPMVPMSVLGKVRARLKELLDAAGVALPPRRIAPPSVLQRLRAAHVAASLRDATGLGEAGPRGASRDLEPQLRILCRTLAQLETALSCGERDLQVEFPDIRQYAQAVPLAHASQAQIYLATPRMQKPNEVGLFRAIARHGPDGILVRNLGGLAFYGAEGLPCVADFSLNAANDLAVHELRRLGALRVTASYDLNRDQLLDMVAAGPPQWLEVVVHQHMPLFHMEHCVFCALLSPGTNHTNCGRPCDHHQVRLRDRLGLEHLLQADVGCRNTLYNAVAQSGAEVVPDLLAAGVRHFRVELLEENADQVRETIGLYRDLLAGRLSGKEVWRQLKAVNRVGVTRGTLEERRNPLAIL
ncbi:MAG: U32 family peptidase, partial [Pirellulaceae bacterium]|nr:U32 family peptidase [Pirellulaceae bacterium]